MAQGRLGAMANLFQLQRIPSGLRSVRRRDLITEDGILLLILVSRGLASAAHSEEFASAFLRSILGPRISETTSNFQTLVAVVDKVTKIGGDATTTAEGVSYALLPRNAVETYQSAEGRSSIRFQIDTLPPNEEQATSDEKLAAASPTQSHEVTVPLANTIFATGKPSTMILRDFRLKDEDGAVKLQATESKPEDVGFAKISLARERYRMGADIPLIPLTTARKVDGVMGNIIRTLRTEEGEVLPASSDLEKAVTAYFQAIQQEPRPVTAWAVISRQAITDGSRGDGFSKMWQQDETVPGSTWTERIQTGHCSIRKVLSGGGGWGIKAGLLSLDPNEIDEPAPSLDLPDFLDGLLPPKGIQNLAEPGDTIQFFICRNEDGTEAIPKTPVPKSLGRSLAFSVLPSSVDAMGTPSESIGHHKPYYSQHFGAASEHGLGLSSHSASAHTQDDRPFRSRLDVPFTWIQATAEPRDAGKPMAEPRRLKPAPRSKEAKIRGVHAWERREPGQSSAVADALSGSPVIDPNLRQQITARLKREHGSAVFDDPHILRSKAGGEAAHMLTGLLKKNLKKLTIEALDLGGYETARRSPNPLISRKGRSQLVRYAHPEERAPIRYHSVRPYYVVRRHRGLGTSPPPRGHESNYSPERERKPSDALAQVIKGLLKNF
jgi:hypothetical protein